MEKNLLSKLDPKGKEHQRKKVLRIFFSWNMKQPKDQFSLRFWDWVKSLSPDNQSSSERYKSMSYEFLDKLLSKKLFRDSISHWIENVYLPSLTKSIEDKHTKYFLNFIMSSIRVKDYIEGVKKKYLEIFPQTSVINLVVQKSLENPSIPGMYIESECTKSQCSRYKNKEFGYIGIDATVTLNEDLNHLKCSSCGSKLKFCNVGFFSCKFIAESSYDQNLEIIKEITNYYNTVDEVHFSQWSSIKFQIFSLTSEEKMFMDNLIFSCFSDPTVPKKKYCKRKTQECPEDSSDIKASVINLEKEIRDLDSQIYDLIKDNYKNSKLIQELRTLVQQ